MNRYQYEVYIVPHDTYYQFKIGDEFRHGEVVDGIGGLDNEHLLIIAYEIKEDEDEQDES